MFKATMKPDNYYMITPPDEIYELCCGMAGSYNIAASRVLGISYPDYLRLCNAQYGAILKGKQGYSYAQWDKTRKPELDKLLIEINTRYKTWDKKIREQLSSQKNSCLS